MNIALFGYGKMGKEIESVLRETKKHSLISIQLQHREDVLEPVLLRGVDVVIDFSGPEQVRSSVQTCAVVGCNLVIGSTGWQVYDDEVRVLVEQSQFGVLVGSNFSIGAQVYFQIVAFASKLCSKFDSYDVYGFEIHHREKKDSPSGTAKTISNIITDNFVSKTSVHFDRLDRPIQEHELHFSSLRGGKNPGLHQVIFDSGADEVRLTHAARGRRGFAEGAVMAAEYIQGKKGYFSFDRLFRSEEVYE